MITMLLVEDETFERTSLSNCIDWELIGVKIIGEAANGAQGLTKVLELKPDIVLTDVKMPVVDGIEMSRRIRNMAPDVKILFLSSYDDFEYAKQAVDLNVSAYLMKPVNEAELLRAVKRIANEINEKLLERKLLSKKQDNLSASLNLARQAFVSRVLSGMHVDEADARNLGLDWLLFSGQRFLVALSAYEPGSLRAIDEALDQLTRRCGRACSHLVNVCVSAGQLVTLCATGEDDVQQVTAQIRQLLREFFEDLGIEGVHIDSASGSDIARLYAQLLARDGKPQGAQPGADRKRGSKDQIASEIIEIIRTQYKSALTLESIARSLHFTPNYVGTLFRSVTKMSVNRYLLGVRMEQAKLLLRDRSLPLSDIAERTGFGSNTYFHTTFKRETGMTPSEYRQSAIGVKN